MLNKWPKTVSPSSTCAFFREIFWTGCFRGSRYLVGLLGKHTPTDQTGPEYKVVLGHPLDVLRTMLGPEEEVQCLTAISLAQPGVGCVFRAAVPKLK